MTYKALDAEEIRVKVLPVLHKYHVKKALLFGSSTRGEMQRGSDIDLIIDIGELTSGLKFIEIKRKMEKRLNRKVDLISYNSLAYSNLEEKILSETQVIYEEAN